MKGKAPKLHICSYSRHAWYVQKKFACEKFVFSCQFVFLLQTASNLSSFVVASLCVCVCVDTVLLSKTCVVVTTTFGGSSCFKSSCQRPSGPLRGRHGGGFNSPTRQKYLVSAAAPHMRQKQWRGPPRADSQRRSKSEKSPLMFHPCI